MNGPLQKIKYNSESITIKSKVDVSCSKAWCIAKILAWRIFILSIISFKKLLLFKSWFHVLRKEEKKSCSS